MTQWYVKDLSQLTGVSVQTLHHYDRIDLLKPSIRLANSYRVYSEKDLSKLQQIIALKFFGFTLAQIKTLLTDDGSTLEHFSRQAQFLQKKAQTLLEASQQLKSIIAEVKDDKSIPWKTIIKLIEVYTMTQQLEETWAGELLTADELKQYAALEAKLNRQPDSKQRFLQRRAELVAVIEKNLQQDPTNSIGLSVAKDWMEMIHDYYGAENSELQDTIWNKGYKKGKVEGKKSMDPAVIKWIDQAIRAYYEQQIRALFSEIERGEQSDAAVQATWNTIMQEMCGDSLKMRQAICHEIMADKQTSSAVKQWLTNLSDK